MNADHAMLTAAESSPDVSSDSPRTHQIEMMKAFVANAALKLEHAEALANVAFVESRAALEPFVRADWTRVAGVYAAFDGPSSPMTQTFGLGVDMRPTEQTLESLEEFFSSRGVQSTHEVCDCCAPGTPSLLEARGYEPIEPSVVLLRSTAHRPTASSPDVSVRLVDPSDGARWADVCAPGWSTESPELGEFVRAVGQVLSQADGARLFIAEIEGEAIAGGSLNLHGGVAILSGSSTVAEARRRGAQRALLEARLAYASSACFPIAMIVTQPDSASMRNAQRHGFEAVYTRTKWMRPACGP